MDAIGRKYGVGEASMARTDRLFETIANYTYDWESWLGVDGKLLWVNPAVQRMTGYSPQSCFDLPEYPLPLVHPEDRAKIAGLLASAHTGGSGNDVAFRIARKDGGFSWGAISWQPIFDDAAGRIGVRTSVRDITERKLAEDAIAETLAETERANLAKSRFLAAASHDLRQPLQAASWFLAAIEREKGAVRADLLTSLRQCLDSTEDLLSSLLDISRLDAGVVRPEISSFAAADLLEAVELDFAAAASEQGVELRVVACSAFLRSDAILLRRIVENLVANALHYTQQGKVLLGARRRGNELAIEVWDSGVGIAPDKQELIFEEFYQIDNPERDRTKGLGLGLSIVRRLARLLGHEVAVRSRPGQGSVFSVTVPQSQEAAVRHDIPVAAVELSACVVAVLEDDEIQAAGLEALLGSYGCTVVAGASAAQVGERLSRRELAPNVILADYRLRDGRTGVEETERLCQTLQKRPPAVLLTGDTEPARLSEVRASGLPVLHKPISADALLQALGEALGGPGRSP